MNSRWYLKLVGPSNWFFDAWNVKEEEDPFKNHKSWEVYERQASSWLFDWLSVSWKLTSCLISCVFAVVVAMRHPLKLVPPCWWSLVLWLALLPCLVCSWPTIPNNSPTANDLRARLLQHVERNFFQAPEALEETIQEVQQILNRDPSLPRLTR